MDFRAFVSPARLNAGEADAAIDSLLASLSAAFGRVAPPKVEDYCPNGRPCPKSHLWQVNSEARRRGPRLSICARPRLRRGKRLADEKTRERTPLNRRR